MRNLDEYLRKNNPYCSAFKQMHEVETEEKTLASRKGTPIPSIKMYIKKDIKDDPRRYN